MNRTFLFSITLLAIILGLVLGFQFRSNSAVNKVVPRDREQELALEKNNLVEDLYAMRQEIAGLTAELERAGIGQIEANEALKKELEKIKRFAGLSPVSGPGVELLLQSDPERAAPGTVPVFHEITDEHLLKMVNELYSAGAEAIAVNNQRITAMSAIRLAGNHININGNPVSSPYRIAATGDASMLKNRLTLKGGLINYLQSEYGVSVAIQEKEQVIIPALSGELNFEYAKPLRGLPKEES